MRVKCRTEGRMVGEKEWVGRWGGKNGNPEWGRLGDEWMEEGKETR